MTTILVLTAIFGSLIAIIQYRYLDNKRVKLTDVKSSLFNTADKTLESIEKLKSYDKKKDSELKNGNNRINPSHSSTQIKIGHEELTTHIVHEEAFMIGYINFRNKPFVEKNYGEGKLAEDKCEANYSSKLGLAIG